METQNFNFTILHDKFNNVTFNAACDYMTQFFYPLDDGHHGIISDGTPQVIEQAVLNSVYLNRVPESVKKWYYQKYNTIRKLVCNVNGPVITETEFNIAPKMLHTVEDYDTIPDSDKENVDFMLDYMRTILCNNNEDQFEYLVKWYANMARGNKNDSALYLKGPQGVGKSTISEFIRTYVVGDRLSYEAPGHALSSNFNAQLEGRIYVYFEELQNVSIREWATMSSKLKQIVTSDKITIEKKGKDSYTVNSCANYVLNSNHDSIKDDNGRRFFICDLSTIHKNDHNYFATLKNKCFNIETGKAFFCYLNSIDLTGYYSQRMPITESKKDSYSKALNSVERFLKFEYVLKEKSICMTVNQLYDNYKNFFMTENNTQKYVTKIEFGKRMKEHNLNYYKSKLNNKCVNKYNITYEELKTISDRGHWVHELDTVIDNDEIIIGQNILPESFQYKYIQASQQLSDACNEIEELRREIEELKKNKAKKVMAKNEYLGITTDDIAEITNIRKIKIRKKSEDIDISNIITCLGIDDESDDEL